MELTNAIIASESVAAPAPDGPRSVPPRPGGSRELLALAAPLILSQSFMTVQVFVDALLLAHHDPREMSASFPAVMWFWLFFGVLQATAGYSSTFVAQYTGAGRPHRVGPAVWQGVHFAWLSGLVFFLVVPAAPTLIALGGHTPALQQAEVTYLRCLAFAALPMLVLAAINGFFSGRGQTWTVLLIEVVGTGVNILFACLLIFGRAGFPELGIAGAGWATVLGSWVSALLAVALFLRPTYRKQFATGAGWWERELFGRLLRYGGPAGIQVFLDVLVFHVFTQMVGRLGEDALAATTITIRLNMVAFLPLMGVGQAVCILVGQRLGGDQADLAEKSTYTGLRWGVGYACAIGVVYLTMPRMLVSLFASDWSPTGLAAAMTTVPGLLVCVAVYSVIEAMSVAFAFALRGAGDTRFVTLLTFLLAWPLLVAPTAVVVWMQANVAWAWVSLTAHIAAMAVCFSLRFRAGRWKTMRVIESAESVV